MNAPFKTEDLVKVFQNEVKNVTDNVTISHEKLLDMFDYDSTTGIMSRRKSISGHYVGEIIGLITEKGYRRAIILGKSYYIHNLVWFYVYGTYPKHEVDHKNGIRDDNRIDNLRPATRTQQLQNRQPNPNKHGLPGIRFDGSKWIARISVNKIRIILGRFDTKEDAYEAYRKARVFYFGEYK